jgi:Ca2+-binding EF-hand superfamily protein
MKNSNRLMLLGGAIGLMLGAAAPAFADFGPWQKADTNKDGSIDRAEFDAQGAERFKAIDANGDGSITSDEMKAFHEARRAKFEAAKGDMGGKFLKRFDKDNDGKISAAEWPTEGRLTFEKADANSDGFVTADEMAKAHKPREGGKGDPADRFAKLDTDKDGKLSVTEWSAMGEKMFARLDDNKDGKISADEMPKHDRKKPQDGEPPVQP